MATCVSKVRELHCHTENLTESANDTLVQTMPLSLWHKQCRVPKTAASILVGLRSRTFSRNYWDMSDVQLQMLDRSYESETSDRWISRSSANWWWWTVSISNTANRWYVQREQHGPKNWVLLNSRCTCGKGGMHIPMAMYDERLDASDLSQSRTHSPTPNSSAARVYRTEWSIESNTGRYQVPAQLNTFHRQQYVLCHSLSSAGQSLSSVVLCRLIRTGWHFQMASHTAEND